MIRSRKHLAWIRSLPCSARIGKCEGPIQAAHVRRHTDGGTGIKPGDNWTIPLCARHHAEQHGLGEEYFESVHNFSMKTVAAYLWVKHGVEPDAPRKKAKKAKPKKAGKKLTNTKFKKKVSGQVVRRDAA